jgi:hypothetical protein
MLLGYLDLHFGLKKPPAVRYRTVVAVAAPARLVLSALAYVGQRQPDEIERAFQAGARPLLGESEILPRPECSLRAFDAALGDLNLASPKVKRDLLSAIAACLAAEEKVTLEQNELLRAIAAVLACPLPPNLAPAGS